MVRTRVDSSVDRAKAAAGADEKAQLARLAFDNAPIGMAVIGLDHRFIEVNRAFASIVGYSSAELLRRSFEDITHPDDVDLDLTLTRKLEDGEIPSYQLAKRYLRKDGSIVHAMLTRSVMRDPSGAARNFVAQIEDVSARVEAEAALRRSEAQFRELIEQAPEAVFVADLDGRYTSINGAAESLLGYTREELVGKTIMDIIPPEDIPRLTTEKQKLLDRSRVVVSQWKLLRKDGSRIPVEVSARIQDDGRWIAFVRDVSERRRAAEALEASRARLARAQRVAHLGSWDWDLRTNEVERSDELLRLFGLAPGTVAPVRLSMSEYIHPDDRARVVELVDLAVHEGRPYSFEHRIVRTDGRERIVLQQGEPVLEGGKPVRVVGTVLDVTERRQAELEREATLKWLRAVVEHSPIGLVLVHASTDRLEANPRALQILGKEISDVTECAALIVGADGAALEPRELPSARALHGEVIEWGEYGCRRPDGTVVPLLLGAAPITNAAGTVDGAVVAFQDISAAKELERLRAEWSSVVAHDLRQPLNTIVLLAQQTRRGVADPDAQHALERIKSSAFRLSRMIGDLMDLSRLDASRLDLTRERLDVLGSIRESASRLALEAPSRPIHIRCATSLPLVHADPDRLAQILDNLLSNAIKYGEADTPIVVDVEPSDGEVAVAVTNEGRGIPEDELPLLFRRFQRASGAKSARIKGTGLGLYITSELVAAHGGRITVSSTPGETTTFRFTLPAVAPAEVPVRDVKAQAAGPVVKASTM